MQPSHWLRALVHSPQSLRYWVTNRQRSNQCIAYKLFGFFREEDKKREIVFTETERIKIKKFLSTPRLLLKLFYSAIHKAAGLTVPDRSMILPSAIPETPISREWSWRLERPLGVIPTAGRTPTSSFVNSTVNPYHAMFNYSTFSLFTCNCCYLSLNVSAYYPSAASNSTQLPIPTTSIPTQLQL